MLLTLGKSTKYLLVSYVFHLLKRKNGSNKKKHLSLDRKLQLLTLHGILGTESTFWVQ